MVEFSELIEKRKSVRKYRTDPVPREKIIEVLEAATLNKLDVWGVNLEDGIMEAYSQAHQVPTIVSFSEANGVQIWYLYEGNCQACNRLGSCRAMLITEAEERGITLTDEDLKAQPTDLAKKIFSKYTNIVNLN